MVRDAFLLLLHHSVSGTVTAHRVRHIGHSRHRDPSSRTLRGRWPKAEPRVVEEELTWARWPVLGVCQQGDPTILSKEPAVIAVVVWCVPNHPQTGAEQGSLDVWFWPFSARAAPGLDWGSHVASLTSMPGGAGCRLGFMEFSVGPPPHGLSTGCQPCSQHSDCPRRGP